MTTNLFWGGYSGSVTILSTELNTLASSNGNTLSTLGAEFTVTTNNYVFADVQFLAGSTYTPVAPAFIELWLLRKRDGINYEDGSATIAPGRPADLLIPVRAGTTITPRAGGDRVILPPNGLYKPIARNQTGASLPASGNTIVINYYTLQSV